MTTVRSTSPRELLKSEIFKLVRQFYEREHLKEHFVRGESRIQYGGRVYDDHDLIGAVEAALDFWLTVGPRTELFERRFSAFVGRSNGVLVNSGSSANLVAVGALASPLVEKRLRAGDEVITPALTFPTSLNPLIMYGLVPTLVDSNPETYNIDTRQLEQALSDRTRLIFIPHILGNCCEVDAVVDFAEDHDLLLVEDCCDALGGKYGGRLLGTYGIMSTFSFYASHHMTTGEGGAVLTDDDDLRDVCISMRDWGRSGPARYDYSIIGYNFRPTDFQAAIGLTQLDKLPGFIASRRRNFEVLRKELETYEEFFLLPKSPAKAEPSWFAFPITIREDCNFSRSDILAWLEQKNVEARPLFAGNILRQPAYREAKFRVPGALSNADTAGSRSFFVGIYPAIDEERINYIAEQLREFLDRAR
jgi:CDP-6-deoxy-D-xylo-4-hexulose-3-dehydrase